MSCAPFSSRLLVLFCVNHGLANLLMLSVAARYYTFFAFLHSLGRDTRTLELAGEITQTAGSRTLFFQIPAQNFSVPA